MSGSLLEVRKKISGVQNTSKITKAMQLVAASKMRQFQKRAVNTRNYTEDLFKILEKLLNLTDKKVKDKSIFREKREYGKTLFVLYTSDKGLCGPLNNKLINGLFKSKKWNSLKPEERLLITIGKKSFIYAQNNKIPVAKSFLGLPEKISVMEMINIIDEILHFWQFGKAKKERVKSLGEGEDQDYEDFEEIIDESEQEQQPEIVEDPETGEVHEISNQIKEIYFIAPHYKNSFTFYPVMKKFLPLNKESIVANLHNVNDLSTQNLDFSRSMNKQMQEDNEETNEDIETETTENIEDLDYMLYSPSKKQIIAKLHEYIIQNMFIQAFFELKASEYSSRMIAMQNATDSANRILNDLRISYNKARQQAITQEIAELIGASMAISENE